ncbi:MAG: SAM-dependent methyltransferase [Caloramator sp.]|nr:SAM-dependent methyltransferase [Caloramator sp.]
MEYKIFINQFLKNPKFTGAILPSSKRLCYKMIEDVAFEKAKFIVEYGAGLGTFTEELIKRKGKETILLVIEYNKAFYDILLKKFGHIDNCFIINDSAENIKKYLDKYGTNKVDYVISGLPFASLPKGLSHNILKNTNDILSNDGLFITFQYTLFKLKLFKSYFKSIKIKKTFINLPPAYVLVCKNFKKE